MVKIGIIGLGTIGNQILQRANEEKKFEVGFVYELDRQKTESIDPSIVLTSFNEFDDKSVDLVVEAAIPEVVKQLGPQIVKKTDFLIFSLTSLADERFRQELDQIARKSGTKIFMPHGAILGLDGIHDGRELLESVEITTVKNPKNLKSFGLPMRDTGEAEVIYEGPTREICQRLPRNVNVHASIALAGLGFDKTHSKIISDPAAETMSHTIEVRGKGLRWNIQVESPPSGEGAITGLYTPESAYQTVKRICTNADSGFRLA